MKRQFEEPVMTIIMFDENDVIVTSGCQTGQGNVDTEVNFPG